MRKFEIGLLSALLAAPALTLATWQIANPYHTKSMHRLEAPIYGKTDYPQNYGENALFTMYIKKGSTARSTVEQFGDHYGWQVTWNTHRTYRVLSHGKISESTFSATLDRFLSHFPKLQATYNSKNKTVTISVKMKHRAMAHLK